MWCFDSVASFRYLDIFHNISNTYRDVDIYMYGMVVGEVRLGGKRVRVSVGLSDD